MTSDNSEWTAILSSQDINHTLIIVTGDNEKNSLLLTQKKTTLAPGMRNVLLKILLGALSLYMT